MSFNCKVKCIDSDGGSHTLGKIYSVVNGKLESDMGLFPTDNEEEEGFKNLDHLNSWMCSKFELYEDPKPLNCKVVCTNDSGENHTIGKAYSIIDGRIDSDDGCLYPCKSEISKGFFESLEELNSRMLSKFELWEDPKEDQAPKTLKDKFISLARKELLMFVDADDDYFFLSGNFMIGNELSIDVSALDPNLETELNIVSIHKVDTRYNDSISTMADNKEKYELLWTRHNTQHTLEELRGILGYDFELVDKK